MSSGWQHFELVGVIGREMTGWECVGCQAHLVAEDRDGRTYGRVAHEAGCTELTVMLGQPREQLSGIGRIGVLERRADLVEASIGELTASAAGAAAGLAERCDTLDDRITALEQLDNVLKGLGLRIEQVSHEQAVRSDGLDNRLTETEVEYRRPGGTHERLRELEKAVLNPRGTVVDHLDAIRADVARLNLAVGGLVEHGPAGHALPRSGRAAATGGPVRPSVHLSEWVFRVSADEDWTEQHLRNAIGDLPGLTVHQVLFNGTVEIRGGGQGTADGPGEPGSVTVTGR